MTEGAAQNKLGELFVDFGTKGETGFLKALSKVTLGMAVGGKTAEALASNIINLSQDAAGTITAFDKINTVTGISIGQLQELEVWSKLNNVSFGDLTNQLTNVQQNLLKIKTGMGGNIKGFALLGIDPRSLDYKKPLDTLTKIKERIQQVDKATGALALSELGLSADLQYAFRQGNNEIDKRLLLTNREIENLKDQQTQWNNLKVLWDTSQQKFIANQTWINKLLQKSADFIANLGTVSLDTFSVTNEGMGKFLTNIGLKMANLARKIMVDWNPILSIFDYVHYLFTGESSEFIAKNKEKMNELLDDAGNWLDKYRPQEFKSGNKTNKAKTSPLTKKINTQGSNNISPFKKEFPSYTDSAIPSYLPDPSVPNISTINNSSNNTITIHVRGDNPRETARETVNLLNSNLDFNIVQNQSNWGL